VVLWSAEIQNFSAAECGKEIRGNLRNILHLIFRKLPLTTFRIPYSTLCKMHVPVHNTFVMMPCFHIVPASNNQFGASPDGFPNVGCQITHRVPDVFNCLVTSGSCRDV